jgi:hypothetical protein
MQTFTVDQIRKYILSKDSIGDVLYYLSEGAILEANEAVNTESEAYKEGYNEYVSGRKLRNPYSYECIEYKQYAAGWNAKLIEEDENY